MTNLLPVQEFLREHSARELFSTHGVCIRPSDDGKIMAVDYDQLAARKTDPLVIECRGLVLRLHSAFDPTKPVGETSIVARPMRRFFNHGEGGPEHQVDLNDPRVRFEEKYDGTLANVYFDFEEHRWGLATRMVPRGDKVLGDGHTARGLFERAVGKSFEDFANRLGPRELTYGFELCTPVNEVHVRQDKFEVTLLAVRHNKTGAEFDPVPFATDAGICPAKTHKFDSVEATLDYIHSQPARAHEGMVAKILRDDGTMLRTKIKNAAYVAVAHLAGSAPKVNSLRSLMSLVLSGNFEDVAPTMNSYAAERGRVMEVKVAEHMRLQDALYESIGDVGNDRRVFGGIASKKTGLNMSYAFLRLDGKCTSYADFVRRQRTPTGYRDGLLDDLIAKSGVKG